MQNGGNFFDLSVLKINAHLRILQQSIGICLIISTHAGLRQPSAKFCDSFGAWQTRKLNIQARTIAKFSMRYAFLTRINPAGYETEYSG